MIEQIAVVFFGVTAGWLVNDKDEKKRKWGPVFGLASQPFWFYSFYMNEQWGMFAISCLYTYTWAKGVKTYWGK